MSRGPDNIIAEAIGQRFPQDIRLSQLLAEEAIDALEREDYRIVHKDQVRSFDEFCNAIAPNPLKRKGVNDE